jgi:diguanylate cyclase (GGDEF)-like protein
VLFIDLDNFKDANDAFGHAVGDAMLIEVAKRLRGGLRSADVLARLGGDEFAVVLTDVASEASAGETAQRLLRMLQGDEINVGDVVLNVEASMGLAYADCSTNAADLLRNADLAMYEAKRDGGGCLQTYRTGLHTAALRRTELEAELRVALEREEFVVFYQPILDVKAHRVIGTEALVRWQHPTRGLVGPNDFITAAEQSGLVVRLGAWVLRTACEQTAQWQQVDPELTVAVNLSPRQLLDRTLVATVTDVLKQTGLRPESLTLEITEGSVIKDYEATVPVLNALRAMGVKLALDDFGTGYSSLSYLKQLPVNSVKIDRSFVNDLDSDTPNDHIVAAIIDLAHALGLSVTAEGAETEGQLQVLQAMGSDQVQGFLLGRPMPHGDVVLSRRIVPSPRGAASVSS